MSRPETSVSPTLEAIPEDLAEAGVYRSSSEGFERGLVVLAAGFPFWLMPSPEGFRLLVDAAVLPNVRAQLALFDREQLGWPPRPVETSGVRGRTLFFGPLLWAVLVLASYWGQAKWPAWTDAGVLDRSAVFQRGEVWRVGTALFLHADGAHLIANAFSGIFVFSAVLSSLGRARGWLSLAVASLAGNLAAAVLHGSEAYRSLGASTAVFAALGLLAGAAAVRSGRAASRGRWRAWWIPLGAGAAVLGLFGAGGQNIDVLAHVTGFFAGLAGGAIAEMTTRQATR